MNLGGDKHQSKPEQNLGSQMFPRLHGENCISPVLAIGLIKNWALASQLFPSNGQHALVELHPSAH